MTEPLDSDKLDRRLWRQYAGQARNPQPPQIDPNTLAAYLDGSADPQQVELVESRLAADPDFLTQLTELRQLSDVPEPSVPASVLTRARSLAHPRLWPTRLRWVAAAAAILVACLGGYSIGSGTVSHRRADAVLSSESALDIDELISEPAFGFIVPLNGNGS